MKLQLTLFSILISFFVQAQTYSELKGKIYSDRKELLQLKNCIQDEAKVDLDRFICRNYWDTITHKHIVFVEKEIRQDTTTTYKILDLIEFGQTNDSQYVCISSIENKKAKQQDDFIIAIECCYDLKKKWADKSKKNLNAWTFNRTTLKLEKLNPDKIYRINEGYYYREK